MPIPDYQTLMLPLLKTISDGKVHSVLNSVEILAKEFNLSEEELNEWLPSGKQKTFYNRVYWAKSHLKMANVVRNVSKGLFEITERGRAILKQNPELINVKFLASKYKDYDDLIASFRYQKKDGKNEKSEIEIISSKTPEEIIETEFQEIKKSLQVEILAKTKSIHPSFFEKLVVELLVKMGYGGSISEAGKATKYTNDEGIDGIIKEDKLGLDVIYIQAKRWEGSVGRPEVQKFVGALAGQKAKKGVLITTSHFTKEAIAFASQMEMKIVLIDGEQLSQLMIDNNLGVATQQVYELKKIDSDYFGEE
ncbi:MAG: hypothetical protein RJA07_545 [Bacteroidota bacterium]|jgi:restriction system protein